VDARRRRNQVSVEQLLGDAAVPGTSRVSGLLCLCTVTRSIDARRMCLTRDCVLCGICSFLGLLAGRTDSLLGRVTGSFSPTLGGLAGLLCRVYRTSGLTGRAQ